MSDRWSGFRVHTRIMLLRAAAASAGRVSAHSAKMITNLPWQADTLNCKQVTEVSLRERCGLPSASCCQPTWDSDEPFLQFKVTLKTGVITSACFHCSPLCCSSTIASLIPLPIPYSFAFLETQAESTTYHHIICTIHLE